MKSVLLGSLKFYQKKISPYLPKACRFEPSCSQYALDAIAKYGTARGGLMVIWRVLRCNPFSKGGFDPA